MRKTKMVFSGFLILLSMGLATKSSEAATQIECFYEDGGYDDEYIYLESSGGVIKSLVYDSYMDRVGPFLSHVGETVFFYTNDVLAIVYMVTIPPGIEGVTLTVLSKNGAVPHSSQYFVCK